MLKNTAAIFYGKSTFYVPRKSLGSDESRFCMAGVRSYAALLAELDHNKLEF